MPLQPSVWALLLLLLLICHTTTSALSLKAGNRWQRADGGNTRNKVEKLPGGPEQVGFNQWTGYVNVQPSASAPGRFLFYWFVESQSNPLKDPLVLWLTGGPGCSSLFASLTENGPFRVDDDAYTLHNNPYSWNKVANVIFVESPCGVGFSYAEDGNYTTGDNDAARDNLQFVLGFFELFPEFSSNEFFIAGESYAGHYVPQLAYKIYIAASQKKTHPAATINLRGIMAGNPSTDWTIEPNYYWSFMADHALIGSEEWTAAQQICAGNWSQPSAKCQSLLTDIRHAFNRINPYNIYAPCIGKSDPTGSCFTHQVLAMQGSHDTQNGKRGGQTFIPCINITATELYLQRADVQKALVVSEKSQKYQWTACSQHLDYVQYATSVLDIYQKLWRKMRILVYSGDVDSCVPYSGTQACIDSLSLPVVDKWRAWLVDNQVVGYVKVLGGRADSPSLTFATVKDAGHMVPTYKPQAALAMFTAFLHGQPL